MEHSNGGQVSGETLKLLRQFPETMRRMFTNKRVLIGSLSVFAHAFCHWGLITFVPFFAVSKSGFNEVSIGLALTANALVMAVCLPIIGSVSDRVGRFLPIALGFFVSVIAFGLMPLITTPWMLIAVMGLLGFCAVLEFPVSQAVTMEAMPLKDRGSATGVWGMMMSLGGTVGIFVESYILSVASIEWVFYFCAAFSLISGIALFAMRSYFKA